MISEDQPSGYTIEIDTGGTFTDGYVSDGIDRVVTAKADTTPFDLTTGVLVSIERAAERLGMTRSQLLSSAASVRLSTTVGTNTLINRNGPAVGVILGADSAHVVASLSDSIPLDSDLVMAVSEANVDTHEIQTAVRHLLERGARVIVVALSGGPELAERENFIRRAVADAYPRHYLGAVPVLPSHQVTPLDDERIRLHTAVLSAYLHPVMSRFLYRVEDALREEGYTRPLLIANADGGTSRVAKTTALRTWGSGPAGGVAATATMASQLELPVAVGYDVGGTSTDICVIVDGRWEYEVQPAIEEIDVALPSLSLVSAAVGGGTVAYVRDGELHLGPHSAGAQPGPACFGLGGVHATVTDAACRLGLFDPAHFLGGRKRLDADAATVVLERLGGELNITADEAAERVVALAGLLIADAIRERANTFDGVQPTSLMATGGAGGILAAYVHRAIGAQETYAFPVSPVFSAFGLSRLDVRHSYEVSSNSSSFDAELDEARRRATADMRTEGFGAAELRFATETEIVDSEGRTRVTDGTVRTAADGWTPRLTRLTVTSSTARGALPRAGVGESEMFAPRSVVWDGTPRETRVYNWLSLAAGEAIEGPAILETGETTLVIPPRFHVEIGSLGEARMTLP